MRLLLPTLLLLSACAGSGAAAPPAAAPAAPGPAAVPALQEVEAVRAEVAAVRARAADELGAVSVPDERWDEVRQDVPTPFSRDLVATRLEAHARRHGLELSQFRLLPMSVAQLDFPAQLAPDAPWPLHPRDALLEAPIAFALTPLDPARIEAFLRTLPEVTPIVLVRALQRGMDFVEVEAAGFTFRPVDPPPRYRLQMPAQEEVLARSRPAAPLGGEELRAFEEAWAVLAREVEETDRQLEALSAERLRHTRLQAWEGARVRAARNAAAIELPPAARAGAPAPRTEAP